MTVTSVVSPESLGVDAERLDALRTRVHREIDAGLLPSCQFALARDGRLAAFETAGAAGPGTRYTIFSTTKAFVAGAAWLLIGEGTLAVDRPVADYIPEFATNGKDAVTVEQVLLHTSGFPRAPLGPPDWGDRDRRLEAFARWRLNWEPGTATEYHATSAHWVLAELVERISGRDYRDFLHERVTAPLGLPRMLGIAAGDQGDVADLVLCGEPATPEELEAVFGVPELPVTEVTDEALLAFNRPDVRAVGVPGGGGIANAATVALFYQALLHNPGGLWDEDVLADATGRVRNTFVDPLFGVPANRALGVIVAGDDGDANRRGFGHTQSPRTFGHNGAGGQVAWADPESGLSFCYLTNGRDLNPIREGRRSIGISSRAAVCTG
ncbi:MAG TPA: serine hydrolase domain-containing protein [Acidimicrobiia bacterium]